MKNVFPFLKALKNNNNKDWFDANKDKYLLAKGEFEGFIDQVIHEIRKFDKKLDPTLTGKQCTFRIYKDVRFSKDKSPYKINMGASINPGGKKSLTAGYYVHCEPGDCFIAGGAYMPEADVIQAIRQEIDYNPKSITKILNAPSFKKFFKGLDEIDKLKTAPKGFEKDHPQIELLKHKHFIVSHKLSDKELSDPKTIKKIAEGFKAMQPFLEFLRTAQDK